MAVRFTVFQSIFNSDPIRIADLSKRVDPGQSKPKGEEKLQTGSDVREGKKDEFVRAEETTRLLRYRSLIG